MSGQHTKKVQIVRKKAQVVERGPKQPVKHKVVVLRKVRDGEEFVKKTEIPVSIGIPQYFQELRKADEEIEREARAFSNKIVIFFIGGPGSGKGTQSERIVQEYGLGYMSTGDLLRKEVDSGSELGKVLFEQMHAGQLVPMEVIISLIKKELLTQEKEAYLIDGFPRKIDQAQLFEQTICPAKLTLYLSVPDDVLTERLLKRAETSGRDDDNPETIQKRLVTFHDVSEPVFNYYQQSGRAVSIDGNREPDEVFADIKKIIDKLLGREPPPVEEEEEAVNEETEEGEAKNES